MKGLRTFVQSHPAAFLLVCLALAAGCGGTSSTPASYDPIELALLRVEPADGESSVPRNRPVRMTFNAPVRPESVHDQSVLVRTGGNFRTRPEGSFLISGNIVEFDPTVTETGGANASGFEAGNQILVEVPLKGVGDTRPDNLFLQNIEGNPIGFASGDNEIAFVTGSGWVDPTPGPPGVLGVEFTPSPNAVGQVTPDAAVTVVFSEPIDPSSVLLGVNMFLTNNTDTSSLYQQDIPSAMFFDGSLTRFTFVPVFGFGQGPFNIAVNFIDPDAPETFQPSALPKDLGGKPVQNFTFLRTFDTQFDPSLKNTGLLRETFTTFTMRDAPNTTASWGDDPTFPFSLVSPVVTTRIQNVDLRRIVQFGGSTVINNPDTTPISSPPQPRTGTFGEEDFCPSQDPLVGTDSIITGFPPPPPSSMGRRQQNLYRNAELGGPGSVIRVAWGPDSDATFAATYPGFSMRLGHKKANTSLAIGPLSAQFDVDGSVTVVKETTYSVPQRKNHGEGLVNADYLDWPKMDTFFEFNGRDDLIVDVEAKEGNTYQQFRMFQALSLGFVGGVCSCFNFAGCAVNNSIGFRQGVSVWGGDALIPPNDPVLGLFNPYPGLHVMQFEFAMLRSDAQSKYYDTGEVDPDYLAPIVSPVVQGGGATVAWTWSGSKDGIAEDVPFTPDINDVDGNRYLRFHAILRSNYFTKARARVALLEIPFTFD